MTINTNNTKFTKIFFTLLLVLVLAYSFFGLWSNNVYGHNTGQDSTIFGTIESGSATKIVNNGHVDDAFIEAFNTLVAEQWITGTVITFVSCSSSDISVFVDTPECSDGKDNDSDGLIDWPLDLECDSALDDDEGGGATRECFDGIDNDGDGDIDYPNDRECESYIDNSELLVSDPRSGDECSDGEDNDGDGKIDYPDDPECLSIVDDTERNNSQNNTLPQCIDGKDNDGDGLIDYPWEPGCDSAIDDDETDTGIRECSDNIDNDNDGLIDSDGDGFNDGDGLIDYPEDPGCKSAADDDESNGVATQCSDGFDNDGDGLIDYPEDAGCQSAADNSEAGGIAQCSDGFDNDEDGLTDYGDGPLNDPGCSSSFGNSEISFTHYIVGEWGACLGVNTDTGQGGTQTRTVDSFESSISPTEEEPSDNQICSLPADFDFLSSSGGVIGNIYNSFVTFLGDQQKKLATPVQIIIDPVFENHPDPTDLTFVVTGVSPVLPAGTDYSFTPNPLSVENFTSGTQFDMDVMKTIPGLYVITIEVTGGDVIKQAIINLNVSVSNPTFEEI